MTVRGCPASMNDSMDGIAWEAFSYYQPLNRASAYILRHLQDHVALGEVVRAACVEPSYFSAYFRRKVGISFTFWLPAVKIAKAAQLLQLQDFSISAVARQVGFKSLRTFERSFKALAGLTPTAFKRSINHRDGTAGSQILAQSTQILSHFSQHTCL